MTTEERFERIEHVTAGLVEERRKDREEYRQLWRDTQRQFEEMNKKFIEMDERLTKQLHEWAEENRAEHERFREADARLAERIDALVSAIGMLVNSMPRREDS